MTKHLNKKELIHPSLLIKYHDKSPPDKAVRKKLIEAVALSAAIMRATVWKMDKVVFFFRDEDYLKDIVKTHFHLGQSGETKFQRLRYLNQIRQCMLSTSFHLNTGVYLLDIDGGHRTTIGGGPMDAETKAMMPKVEGYVATTPGIIFDTTGPIHLSFKLAKTYTARGLARVIIHEATHSFWKTIDVFYSHQAGYQKMKPEKAITNADSYAYAALSIEAKETQTWATLRANSDH